MSIKFIGIDPAPVKKSTCFDGVNFGYYNYNQLKEYLIEEKKCNDKLLICWDAPLSFSLNIDSNASDFYQRKIEFFFSRKEYNTPKGISVRGYAGCPHWAITQYLLGLPKISNFEKNFCPPFDLIFNANNITKSVTEVHPAVAIWLWCKDEITDWEYKKNKTSLNSIIKVLKTKNIIGKSIEIKNDDELDAFVAWKLGKNWVEKTGEVAILGKNKTGSFLLPYR
jgi:hypothetical protein